MLSSHIQNGSPDNTPIIGNRTPEGTIKLDLQKAAIDLINQEKISGYTSLSPEAMELERMKYIDSDKVDQLINEIKNGAAVNKIPHDR